MVVALVLTLSVGLAALAGCGTSPQAAAPRAVATAPAAGSTAARTSAAGGTVAPASAASSSAGGAGGGEASALPTLSVAYSGHGGGYVPLWMAAAQHYFQRFGVNVKLVSMERSSAMVAALLSGQVDAVHTSAPGFLPAALRGGSLVLVAGVLNHMVNSLYSVSSVRAANQLKGKLIEAGPAGSPAYYGTEVELSLLHIAPSQVRLQNLGNTPPEQFTQLITGKVQAATLFPPFTFTAAQRGYVDLVDTYSVPYQNVGVIVRRSTVAKLKSALIKFLMAYRYAIQQYNADPTLAMATLQKYTHAQGAVLKETYDLYHTKAPFNLSLQPSLPGIQATLNYLANTLPAAKGAKAAGFVDDSVLRALPSGGGQS